MRIQVHVTPKSRAPGVEASRPDGLVRVRVRAAPEGGRANEAVLEALREQLGVSRGAVRLVGGAGARHKWVEIDGLDEEELWRRLQRRLER